MKKALLVGINNYVGTENDLKGAVNDVEDWRDVLATKFGFYTNILLNSQATKANIKNALIGMLDNAKLDDVLVFQYSGHGTNVIDRSGDEVDGYDEALYVYDGVLLDDELREIFKNIPNGVQMIVILDSCFSGTATRIMKKGLKPRYVVTDKLANNMKRKKSFLVSDMNMKEILLAGCKDDEYSYDAYIDGRWNGAFSYYAVDVLTRLNNECNYYQFIDELHKELPSSKFDQTPQLECTVVNAEETIFAPMSDDEPDIPEEPDEPEEPVSDGSWFERHKTALLFGGAIIIMIILFLIFNH